MCMSILSSMEFDADAKAALKSAYDDALAKLAALPVLSRQDFQPDDVARALVDLFRDGQRDVRRLAEDAVFRIIRAVPTTAADASQTPRAAACELDSATG